MSRKLLVIIGIVFFYTNSFAQDSVRSFSLSEATQFAIKNNYNIQNSRTEILQAKKIVAQTAGIGLPQITSSASYQDFIDIPTQLIPGEFFGQPEGTFIPVKFGTKHNLTGSLTAS